MSPITDMVTRIQHHSPNDFRCFFVTALRDASRDGTLSSDCLAFLRSVRYLWSCSTQDIEGRNSLISIMTDRCPSASIDLVSERLRIKSALCLGHRGASTKWSAVKPFADMLVVAATCHFSSAGEIVAEEGRWVAPVSPEVPPQVANLRSSDIRFDNHD